MHELRFYQRMFVRGTKMSFVVTQIFGSSEDSPEFLASRNQGHSLVRIDCTFVESGIAARTMHQCRDLLCGALLVMSRGFADGWTPNLLQSTALTETCSGRQMRHELFTRQLEKALRAGDLDF
jgi:hypothetical protein